MIYPVRVRECAKLGCRQAAVATMATRYRDRIIWVADLIPERDPGLIELCDSHADSMVPPFGWELVDDRRPIEVPELIPEALRSPHAATA